MTSHPTRRISYCGKVRFPHHSLDKGAQFTRNRHGLPRRRIHPDDFRRTKRKDCLAADILDNSHLIGGFEAAAPEMSGIGAHFDRPRIGHRHHEGTGGIDNHRSLAHGGNLVPLFFQPFAARLFHEAEVDGVIHVAVGVHIAPANGNLRGMNQLVVFFHFLHLGLDQLGIFAMIGTIRYRIVLQSEA